MTTRAVLQEQLLIRLEDLPAPRLQEVLDFVDFLLLKEKDGEDPILKVAGCLSGEPLSAATIEDELYGKASS
jgi:hypothetical protein